MEFSAFWKFQIQIRIQEKVDTEEVSKNYMLQNWTNEFMQPFVLSSSHSITYIHALICPRHNVPDVLVTTTFLAVKEMHDLDVCA